MPFLWFDDKAGEAMLKMKKIDIRALKKAYEG